MFNTPLSGGQIGFGISHKITHQDAGYPVYINDDAITEGQSEYVAVSLIAGTNHTVKGAVEAKRLAGYLVSVENRVTEGVKVGTMQIHGGAVLPIKTGDALAVGDLVIGAGAGEVRVPTTDAERILGVGRTCTAIRTDASGNYYAEVIFG